MSVGWYFACPYLVCRGVVRVVRVVLATRDGDRWALTARGRFYALLLGDDGRPS